MILWSDKAYLQMHRTIILASVLSIVRQMPRIHTSWITISLRKSFLRGKHRSAATFITVTSQWARCVSNHQPLDCLLNRLFRRRSKKTSKLRATGLCAGNSPETGEFPAERASNAENVSIWWRHHVLRIPSAILNDVIWSLNGNYVGRCLLTNLSYLS